MTESTDYDGGPTHQAVCWACEWVSETVYGEEEAERLEAQHRKECIRAN